MLRELVPALEGLFWSDAGARAGIDVLWPRPRGGVGGRPAIAKQLGVFAEQPFERRRITGDHRLLRRPYRGGRGLKCPRLDGFCKLRPTREAVLARDHALGVG